MADFLAGYISGAIGILVGNPLDVLKTRLQASSSSSSRLSDATLHAVTGTQATSSSIRLSHRDALRGLAAPVLTYGALNAVLFATYNRSLSLINPDRNLTIGLQTPGVAVVPHHPYWAHFAAGCLAGIATFVISAPTEVVKCRAQIVREQVSPLGTASRDVPVSNGTHTTSWTIARDMWRAQGIRGFYHGGFITAVRDAVGYGFYYLAYEAAKDVWDSQASNRRRDGEGGSGNTAAKVLVCGGLAGVVTWASIFPLDVIKTRVQTQELGVPRRAETGETAGLLGGQGGAKTLGAWAMARQAYHTEGVRVFFRGIGVCCARAFVVNAVQWGVYEWVMMAMSRGALSKS